MEKCGDADDCISTSDAAELAAKLDEQEINNLPMPGQVDFINGGPPCQVCTFVGILNILLQMVFIGHHSVTLFFVCFVCAGFLWDEQVQPEYLE